MQKEKCQKTMNDIGGCETGRKCKDSKRQGHGCELYKDNEEDINPKQTTGSHALSFGGRIAGRQ